MYYYGVIIQDEDGLSPRRKYMEFASRGVHHTYIHSDSQGRFMYIITKYLMTLLLKYISVYKLKS